MKRGKVFAVIKGERDYQDSLLSKGKYETVIHSVGAELALMKVYVDEALVAWAKHFGDAPGLHAIRKVTAIGVRCMENHGALPREGDSKGD